MLTTGLGHRLLARLTSNYELDVAQQALEARLVERGRPLVDRYRLEGDSKGSSRIPCRLESGYLLNL